MEIMETSMGRRELLMQAVGGLRERVDDLRQQLVSMESEIASIESEIECIDAVTVAETRGIKKTGIVSMGKRNVTKIGSHSTPHWDLHALMNPALWSTLPMEIQQLVFARLPWREIIRLRCLSKQWNQCVSSENSEFRRVCTAVNPKIFAMINHAYEPGIISIRMYDINTDRWHHLIDRVVGRNGEFSWTMFAGDGGLVCIVFPPRNKKKKKKPLLITVCNPLTRQYVNLPSHDMCSVRPRMVQLVMDKARKCYKVIVVDKEKRPGEGVVAQIYSSETRSWSSTSASADLIFGHKYDWCFESNDEYLEEIYLGPCAYDCAKGQLLELKDPSSDPWTEASLKSYALVKDRLFVLHEEPWMDLYKRYCISEYRGQKEKPNWVKVKVHGCKGFALPPHSVSYTMRLNACKGFLLVTADNGEEGAFRHELTWLYDLSTGIWQDMPLIPLDEEDSISTDAMFELQWDAVP